LVNTKERMAEKENKQDGDESRRWLEGNAAAECARLEQLANRLGISKQKLDLLWREFKQRFPGVVAPWEKSEVAKEAYRQAHRQGDRSPQV